MTPDDYLGPGVHGTVRFENGIEYEVTARPRKGVGFTDDTVIGFKPLDGRGTSAMKSGLLRLLASTPERFEGWIDPNPFSSLTSKDAGALVAWLDGVHEVGEGK